MIREHIVKTFKIIQVVLSVFALLSFAVAFLASLMLGELLIIIMTFLCFVFAFILLALLALL